MQKERAESQKELGELRTKTAKISQEFEELQKAAAADEAKVNELKASNVQVSTQNGSFSLVKRTFCLPDGFSSTFTD